MRHINLVNITVY